MMKILIGSSALKKFCMERNEPSDIDYWTDDESITSIQGEDWKYHPTNILTLIPTEEGVATPDAVYTIKCSHLGWDVHWDKTKADVLWLKAKGCVIVPDLYDRLVERWCDIHGDKSFLSLNQSKEQFFTDKVDYKFDHDHLHELVSYPNRPMYESVLKEGESVAIDKSKFDDLEFGSQVRMFREEITVIACERWLLNDYWKGKVSWYQAYMWSLKKTITNLTKGWATSFIVINLEHFIKPDFTYFKHLLTTIEEGIIMSKVDLSVFEELLEVSGGGASTLEQVVYHLCSGEFVDGMVEYEGDWDNHRRKGDKMVEDWKYKHLDQDGGGEGGGEYCYGVFELKGKVYRAEYSYYSYNGHDYDDILRTLKEVKPVQKTITVYE